MLLYANDVKFIKAVIIQTNLEGRPRSDIHRHYVKRTLSWETASGIKEGVPPPEMPFPNTVASTADFPPGTPQLNQSVVWRLLVPTQVLNPGTLSGKTGIAITAVCTTPSVVPAMYTLLPKTMTLTLEVPVSVPVLLVLHIAVMCTVRSMVVGIVAASQTPQIHAYLECDQSVQFAGPAALQLVFQASLKSQVLLVSELPP